MPATPTDKTFGRRTAGPQLVAGADSAAEAADQVVEPRRAVTTVVVRSARAKTAALALASAILGVFALVQIHARLLGGVSLGMIVEMAEPLILLGAAFALAGLVIRRPILTISERGLSLRHFRGGVWAWGEIERIEMRMSRRGFLQVVLRLCDEHGETRRRRLPGMWTTSPHQLASMLEAARRTAAKGRREDIIATVEAAREAHAESELPYPIQVFTRTLQRFF